MSISLSNMNSIIGRMAAENAVENGKTNKLIFRVASEQEQALLDARNKANEAANSLQNVSNQISVGTSMVKVGQSVEKVGQSTKDAINTAQTKDAMNESVGAGQAESAKAESTGATSETGGEGGEGAKGAGAAKVAATSLGNGMTVGDRFGKEGTNALLKSDIGAKAGETRGQWDQRVGKELKAAKLTDKEVDQIYEKAKDGKFDTKDAVEFMYDNRNPPSAKPKEDVAGKLREAMAFQVASLTSKELSMTGSDIKKNAKGVKEEAAKQGEVGSRALDDTLSTNEKQGELDLKAMRQRRGASASVTR